MIMFTNEMADLDILVVYIASGTGIFNCDTRRLTGFYSRLPKQLLNPKIKFFEPFQKHYDLLRFGTNEVTYADFLKKKAPLFWLTAKCLNGRSGLITPALSELRSTIGTNQQRGLHSIKSDLDITGNIMDLIVVHKNKVNKSYFE